MNQSPNINISVPYIYIYYIYILYIYTNYLSIYLSIYIIYYIYSCFFMYFLGSPIVPFDSIKPSPSDTRFSCCPKPSHRRLAQVVLEPLGRWSPGCPCLTARIEPWQMTICCGEFRPRIRKCGYIYIYMYNIYIYIFIIETYCAQA